MGKQSQKSWKQNHYIGLLLSHFSRVRLCATPWTAAHQAPPSTGFSRQECWSGVPFPPPGHLPDPGMEPGSLALQAGALLSEPQGKPRYKYSSSCLKMIFWVRKNFWVELGHGKRFGINDNPVDFPFQFNRSRLLIIKKQEGNRLSSGGSGK